MKRLLPFLIALLFAPATFAQTLLMTEDFEDNSHGTDYRANRFNDGTDDVWLRWNIDSSPAGPNPKASTSGRNFFSAYSGYVGNYAWGGEDVDDNGNPLGSGNPGYLLLRSLDVSSLSAGDSIEVRMYVGGNSAETNRYETSDYFRIEYAFDANIATGANSTGGLPTIADVNTGTYTTFGAYYGGVGASSSDCFEDNDLNGAGDVGAQTLQQTLRQDTFKFEITGSPSNVSIRINALGGPAEEWVFDQIEVYSLSGGPCVQTADTVQAGSGIVTSSGNTVTPQTTFFEDGRQQLLYLASEINAAGGCAGNLAGMAFNFPSVNALATNATISLKETTDASFSSFSFDNTGFTTVYNSTFTPTAGWNWFNFSSNFAWDGTSNIIVNYCYNNTAFTGNTQVEYETTSFTSHRYAYTDNTDGCILSSFGSNAFRANARFRYPVPTVSLADTDISCSGLSDGKVVATVSDGTPNYSYNWSNGVNTLNTSNTQDSITGLAAGTYTVTITDDNGKTATASATITTPTALTNSTSVSSNVSCNGAADGSATISVAGGTPSYTYLWSNGGTSATNSSLSAGTHTVTVTDANGCTVVDNATVTEPTAIVLAPSSTSDNCSAGTGTATVSPSGGSSPYTYLWSNAATSATASSLVAGTYTVTVTDNNGCTATTSTTVSGTTAPTVMLTDTDISCFGAGDGKITSSVSGGTSPYTYLWSNTATTDSLTNLLGGTYTVTVTDNGGCTATSSATITSPTALTNSTSVSSNVSCNGGSDGSATITVAGGTPSYTYLWSNGGTSATNSSLAAGTHTVTVTDANGCTLVDNATVSEPTAIVLAPSSTSDNCSAGTGTATVAASGGSSPYTYLWSNAATSATASSLVAGTYTVTVTDNNGCTATTTATVSGTTGPTVGLTDTDISCFGAGDGKITSSVSGGTSPYTYLWSNSATTDSLTNLLGGTYTVTVTDNGGCTATTSATITSPTPLTNSTSVSSNVSCNGGSDGSATIIAAGGTPSYTYLWSNGGTNATNSSLSAGTHTVTVTDANGCTVVDNATVSEPAAISLTPSSTNSTCGASDGTATVSASGGTSPYTYLWSNAATSATATGLLAGTYTVTVTDNNGCTATVSETVTDAGGPSATASVTGNVSCNGGNDGSASVSASSGATPYTYLWSSGSTSVTAVGLTAGNHTVTVTDNNGCSITDGVTITEPTAVSVVTADTDISCFGAGDGSITTSVTGGTGAYTYLWSNAATSASLTSMLAGNYTVTVTDNNGCTATASATITTPTALTNSTSVSANVTCNGGSDGSATISVAGGTPTYTYLWSNGGTSATNSTLSAGVHTVTVTDANGCTITDNATVTEPTAIVISNSVTDVSQNGLSDGSITASASGGTSPYTYAWNTGGTTATISSLPAGTYSVTVTDGNGCTDSTAAVVNEPPPFVVSIDTFTNVTCNGFGDGSATAGITFGTSPYTYLWSTGATATMISSLSPGAYTVTVTDNVGLTGTATATITEPTSLSLSGTSGTNVSCNGGANGTATTVAAGGTSPYTYVWSNGGMTASLTGLMAGSYTVTATDANGCTVTGNVSITEPAALSNNMSVTDVSCNGFGDGTATANVSGGTSPYSYVWSSGPTSSSITGLVAGTYTVTVTDNNGCTMTDVAVIIEPTALSFTFSVTDVSCNGFGDGSIAATASGGTPGYTYAWQSGPTGATLSGLSGGTYTVTVTDGSGCTMVDSTVVFEPTAIAASISASTDVTCTGDSNGTATVMGSGGVGNYTYTWFNGSTTASVTNLPGGTMGVTVADSNGCQTQTSVFIFEPNPVLANVNLLANVTCNGAADGSVSVTPGGGVSPYNVLWSNGDTTTTINGLMGGTYTVTVADSNGCLDTNSVTVAEPMVVVLTASQVTGVTCNGLSDGTALAVATGGANIFSYTWATGGVGGGAANGLAAGTYSVTVTDINGCTDSTSATITEPTPVSVTITSSADATCNGFADGQATAAGSGGTAPYVYNWSNGSTGAVQTSFQAGTYTVTVFDSNLCSATSSVTIGEPTALTTSITSVTDVSCNGGSDGQAVVAAAGGTAPYTYNWTGGQTTDTASMLAFGVYNVTVTDTNGCTAFNQTIVLQPQALASTISGTDAACNGANDGSAQVTITGGTAPYTYSWSSGSISDTAQALGAGTYTVTVTDTNGCMIMDTIMIGEPTAILASATSPNLGGGVNVSCVGGSNGSANLSVSGGTLPYTYSWTGPSAFTSTNQNLSGLGAGTYDVTITDGNGCTSTASVTLVEPAMALAPVVTPVVLSGGVNISCNGGSDGTINVAPAGGTAPYSYQWTGPNGFTSTMQNPTGLEAGVYQLTVSDDGGCTDIQTVTLTQPLQPILASINPVAFSGGVNISCNGESDGAINANVLGGGTAPYNYAWTGPNGYTSTLDDIGSLAAGSYTLVITDDNGCTWSDSTILVEPDVLSATPTSPVLGNGFNVSCSYSEDGNIALNPVGGTPSYGFVWDGPGTFSSLVEDPANVAAGTYNVTLTDGNGCTFTTSHVVTAPPAIVITPAVTVESPNGNDGAIDLTVTGGAGGFSYAWSTGATTEDISSLVGGSYTVTVTDSDGCEDSLTIDVISAVGIPGLASNLGVNLFPNPTNGQFTVAVSGYNGEEVQLSIVDVQGREVIRKRYINQPSEWREVINLDESPQGLYFLRLVTEDELVVRRVVLH